MHTRKKHYKRMGWTDEYHSEHNSFRSSCRRWETVLQLTLKQPIILHSVIDAFSAKNGVAHASQLFDKCTVFGGIFNIINDILRNNGKLKLGVTDLKAKAQNMARKEIISMRFSSLTKIVGVERLKEQAWSLRMISLKMHSKGQRSQRKTVDEDQAGHEGCE